MAFERANGTKEARVIQVIETKAKRGIGIEKDPIREVTQYWDLDGKFLAERDEDKQYLADHIKWECERMNEIIEEWKEEQQLPRNSVHRI